MNIGKFWIVLLILISLSLVSMSAAAGVSPNARLLQRPEWDGAIVSGSWLSGEFRYQQYDIGNEDVGVMALGPTFATSLPNIPQLELGSRLWLMNADYDSFDGETGLGDIDCWGKYQFLNQNNFLLSGGLLLTLPTGDEGIVHPRATGEINIEVFAAGRYHVNSLFALVGHFGIRKNSDADIDLERDGFGRGVRGELDGEAQIEVGGGLIYQAQPDLNILGEFNIATEAYDNSDSDIGLTGGVEYMLQPDVSLKGGLGLGLDDGAPDFELIGACTFFF